MDEEDRTKQAFQFASDTSKQLLTLSTAIVTLTVTFARDLLPEGTEAVTGLLILAWISFLVSVLFGVWTLLALTGSLIATGGKPVTRLAQGRVRIPAVLQVVTFVLGLILTVLFGMEVLL